MKNPLKNSFISLLTATSVLLTPMAMVVAVPGAIAQQVTEPSPAINSQNVSPDTSIAGQFSTTNGVGVDPNSVRIVVNGQDVTTRSTITRNFFSYRPSQPFAPGAVLVEVNYRTTRGQAQQTRWTFNVQQPQSAVQISSVTHNAVGTTIATGATFLATINGTPGSQAAVLLVQDGRTVREVAAQEVSAGVYVATVTVGASDRVSEGIVVGRLRRQNQTTYAAAARPFALGGSGSGTSSGTSGGNSGNSGNSGNNGGNSGNNGGTGSNSTAALQPRFTSHRDGDRVSSGFTLVGQTRPNATVQIEVVSTVSLLDVVNLGGQTLVDQDVTANSAGEFRITVPAPQLPVPGTSYRIRATATSGTETSPQTEITLRQR